MSRTHFLPLSPERFRAVTVRTLQALVLKQSLGLEVGHQLLLREWNSAQRSPSGQSQGDYTGNWIARMVSYVDPLLDDVSLRDGYVLVSLNDATENEWATAQWKKRLSTAVRQGVSPERFWQIMMQQELAAAEREQKREPGEAVPHRNFPTRIY